MDLRVTGLGWMRVIGLGWTLTWGWLETASAALVINEFMATNQTVLDDAGEADDWVELYNSGDQPLDLSGLSLTDDLDQPDQWEIPQGITLAAHEFIVFWADNQPQQGPLHMNFKLSASGEEIGLFNADRQVIDMIRFGSQVPNTAYGRSPDASPVWQTLSLPTPGAANVSGADSVLISEIMYHPYHSSGQPENLGAEYIELCNNSTSPVDLTDWALTGGVDFVFPDLTLAAGDWVVVAADVTVFDHLYPGIDAVVGPWSGHLSNRGEAIVLRDNHNRIIDQVEYADQGDWAQRILGASDHGHRGWEWSGQCDGGGCSLELIEVDFSNAYGQNWSASLVDGGTPGRVNSVTGDDIAPVIQEVTHEPLIPGPTDQVMVRALVLDDHSDSLEVTLYYRVDQQQTAFTSLPLFDDGNHGDGSAGDHVYGTRIPAQADKAIVEFYIEARDAGALQRTWPAPVDVDGTLQQAANALYQVDGSFDGDTSWQPGSPPIYTLIMTENERAELETIGSHSDDAYSMAQMNGTFISVDGVDIKARYQVGIRNRGAGSRTNSSGSYRNNYRINFTSDNPWQGVTALNIKNRYGYSQLLGAAIFRQASLAAADTTRIELHVNGQNLALDNSHMYGSYVAVEVMNSDFTAHQFPDDARGNLYRTLNEGGDLGYEGSDPDNYRSHYQKETNSSAEDFNDLVLLTDVLNNTVSEDYVQQVSQVINLTQWLRMLAVDCLAGNREGGLTTPKGDDYALYRGVQDQRFILLPYDLDTVFGLGDASPDLTRDIHVYSGLDGLHELLTHPDILPLYHSQLLELSDTIFSPEQFDPLVDELLTGWVPGVVTQDIKTFAIQRRAAVLDQIPRVFAIDSDLSWINGYPTTLTESISLFGSADCANTHSVTVNGTLASWSPMDGVWGFGGGTVASDFLIPVGSVWTYMDDGSDCAISWRTLNYDDSAWPLGEAELGYGDGDEATVVSYGPSSSNKHITTYFRHVFEVTDLDSIESLRLQLLADDGAVIYLNGLEVGRQNMPSGTVTYLTTASTALGGSDETIFVDIPVSVSDLHAGLNVLAVEVHQAGPTSSDISFNASLGAVRPASGDGRLAPGLNHLVATAWDGPEGSGQAVQQGSLDLWYDTGYEHNVSTAAPLSQDVVWSAAQGPYHISGDLVIPVGVTLTIEAGTSVFFDSGAQITIQGCLQAQGEEHAWIHFTRTPGTSDNWGGLQFLDTQADNRIDYAIVEYGRTNNGMVGLENANLTLEHVTFDHTDLRRIRTLDSSLIINHCTFTDLFDADEAPSTDNMSEHIWGAGVPADGHFIISNSTFGVVKGHNDAIDFDGPTRPNPIPQILNNTFLGGGDDALDLESDAHIEGNRFMNFIKDQYNGASGESNGISAGHGQHYVMVRNIFQNVQHVAQVKDDAFLTFVNNTVVDVTGAAIYFELGLPGRTAGRGAAVDGTIFWNCPQVFAGIAENTELTIDHSLLPEEWLDWGQGNVAADPLFVDDQDDFHLLPESAAYGSGPLGLDMGAMVPAGVVVAGIPLEVTCQSDLALNVGGPGITHYQYSLNDPQGPWSADIPVETPLDLTGLADGASYRLYVMGRNSAGLWQAEPSVTSAWRVDRDYASLYLNEILATNVMAQEFSGIYPDLVELAYEGRFSLDLAGIHCRKDPNGPVLFTFGAGTVLEPGQLLVLAADKTTSTQGIHLGFTLDRRGDALYLYDPQDHLLDSIDFGMQIPDLSIGRVGPQGDWTLTLPTLGQDNVAAVLGDSRVVKINEWLAHGDWMGDDFVELYNPETWPVAVGNLTLTDLAHAPRQSHRLAPLSFISAQGTEVWTADNQDKPGHLGLKLSSMGESLALLEDEDRVIDQVTFGPQTTDISQGCSPDGVTVLAFFDPPTPGAPNPGDRIELIPMTLIPMEGTWSYQQNLIFSTDIWTQSAYNDASWSTGPALLYVESSGLPAAKNTPLTLGATTYYFRTHFQVDDLADLVELTMTTVIDDGAVIYLNGQEVMRIRMPAGAVTGSTLASATVGNAILDGPFALSMDDLVMGDNVLAVEVHQVSTSSSDVVLGISLDAVIQEVISTP